MFRFNDREEGEHVMARKVGTVAAATVFLVALNIFHSAIANAGDNKRIRTINSHLNRDGQGENGTAPVRGPAEIECVKADGDTGGTPPACYVTCVPNCGTFTLSKGQTGGTSGAGSVTLQCNGRAPLACSVRITD